MERKLSPCATATRSSSDALFYFRSSKTERVANGHPLDSGRVDQTEDCLPRCRRAAAILPAAPPFDGATLTVEVGAPMAESSRIPECGEGRISSQRRQPVQDARRDHEAAAVPARRADRGAAHGAGALRLPPGRLLLYVAHGLKLPPSRVYGVATFYHFFTFAPKGEHTCVVCMGTACYVKGAETLLAAVRAVRGRGEPGGQGRRPVRLARDGAVPGRLRPGAGRGLRRRGLRHRRARRGRAGG